MRKLMKSTLWKLAIAGCVGMLLTGPWGWHMPLLSVISSLLCLPYFVSLMFYRHGDR